MGLFGIALVLLLLVFLVMAMLRKWSFNHRVFLALFLGIMVGYALKLLGGGAGEKQSGAEAILIFLGQGYFGFLRMLVIPLILTSIIHAILQLGKHHQENILGKIIWKSVALLMGLTALSSGIGLLVAVAFGVGKGMVLPSFGVVPEHTYTGLTNTLLGMIPSNPVAMLVNENTVAIVIFSILVGSAGLYLGKTNPEKLPPFELWIESAFWVMKRLASIVIMLTPYGVFGLIGEVIIHEGLQSLEGLFVFIVAMYVSLLLVLLLHSVVLWLAGQNPWRYFREAYAPLLVGFMTRSSFGTLPVTQETLDKKLKIRQVTATFVPSIACTMGMNACAGVFPAVLVVMAMTILHQPITIGIMIIVMLVNMIASLGISGIPGTAFVAATVTLTTLGLPYSVVGLVQGIDPIIDMGRTAVNINGAMVSAVVSDRATDDKNT
jgi:uncharacterized protein